MYTHASSPIMLGMRGVSRKTEVPHRKERRPEMIL
jgi:hypothetical protein